MSDFQRPEMYTEDARYTCVVSDVQPAADVCVERLLLRSKSESGRKADLLIHRGQLYQTVHERRGLV